MVDIIVKDQTAEVDDEATLKSLIAYIQADNSFDYMRQDGGLIKVLRFVDDTLTLAQEGKCGACTILKLAATKRRVQDRIKDMFPQIEIEFQASSGPASTLVPQPA